jgi:putative ABC transport system permease protein
VAPDIAAVAPTTTTSEVLTYGTTNWTTSAVGTTPQWLSIRNETLAEGRFIVNSDVTNHAAVTVLAATTAQQLFGRTDPVGQIVNVGTTPMTVIGVLNSVGSSSTTNQDDQALVPLTTATNDLVGGASRNNVSQILIEATSAGTLSGAYQEANAELLALHNITTPTGADFTITTQQDLLSTSNSVNQTLTVLLGGVAGISLLVGGIGVMNIMLVSVTERVREIGLRKALGATPRINRRQFLVEASFLGLVGGILGAAIGIVGAVILPHFISDPISISATAPAGSIIVAIVIGVSFGVYPASRAARMAPIDALRSE